MPGRLARRPSVLLGARQRRHLPSRLRLFYMSVERNTFMPKNGLRVNAYRRGVPRVSISVRYTRMPGPRARAARKLRLQASRHRRQRLLLGSGGQNDSIRFIFSLPRPPAELLTTSPGVGVVSAPSGSRALSRVPEFTFKLLDLTPYPFSSQTFCVTKRTGSAPDIQARRARCSPRSRVVRRPNSRFAGGPGDGSLRSALSPSCVTKVIIGGWNDATLPPRHWPSVSVTPSPIRRLSPPRFADVTSI